MIVFAVKRYRTIMIVALVAAALAVGVQAEDRVHEWIRHGRLEAAADSLSKLSTAAMRNGNLVFYQALLEPDGDQSAQLMSAALKASVDPEYQEAIYLRLAQHALLAGDLDELQHLIADYRSRWESGQYADEMMRYSALVDERGGRLESSLRQVDRYVVRFADEHSQQWGTIDRARLLLANDKAVGARKLLRTLSRRERGPGIPQALYLLTHDAIDNNRVDDAVFFYNLLREGYPKSVGLLSLVDRLSELSAEETSSHEADRLTGTYYSVQVGVFSEPGNAKRQGRIFEKYGLPVDVRTKTISNVEYRVVYVGRFGSYPEASAFKTQLEAEHGEAFQVVAR